MFGNIPSLQEIVMMIPGIVMAFTFHEFAHAWTATLFGDDTPRLQGRVTLNPMAHLDPLGTILILIGGFGWAKPVQVDVDQLKPRVWGDIVVSLAGVTINLLLAILFYFLALITHLGFLFGYENPILDQTLLKVAHINLILVIFNLIPLPPLDGFRVAKYLFPPSMASTVAMLYRFSPLFLMFLIFSGAAGRFMGPVYELLLRFVAAIVHPVVRAMLA